MSYEYSEAAKVLDEDVPLVTAETLLLICKEIDEDTPDAETESFIADAHTLVCSLLDGWGVAATLLTLIEKNLAAHFAALTYPSTQKEGLGPLSASYALKVGMGLEATRYGQTAVALDPTGELKNFSEGKGKRRVSMYSLGSGILTTE